VADWALWLLMVRRFLPLFVLVLFAAWVPSSAAARVEHFEVQPDELPYQIGTYPLVSGRYTLLSLEQFNSYVLFDDQTGAHSTITPPHGCGLWANAFAAPWVLFYCGNGGGPTLYNIHTRRWTAFPCGQACEDIGVAAPEAIGSDWVDINENAYCDPRMGPCDTPDALVALPSGRLGTYTPSPNTLIDLSSPSLSQPICAPWSRPAAGSLSLDGGFVVLQKTSGVTVARCGSSLAQPLVSGDNGGLAQTAHLVASCPLTSIPYALSQPGPYDGVFLPSLTHFTLTLPPSFMPCTAYFDDDALYLWSEQGNHVWRAELPTAPLPTYPSCPRTDAASLPSTNPAAYQQLVPTGTDQVLLCRYGQSIRSRLLAHRLITSATTASSLTRILDRLPSSGQVGRCATAGETITAFFRYASADDVPVTIHLTGCSPISNGHLRRNSSDHSARALIRRMDQLA
jgi:hypothetical protein